MTLACEVERFGFSLVEDVVDSNSVAALIEAINRADIARSVRGNATFGARNMFSVGAITALARVPQILERVSEIIGPGCQAVRGLFFDKTIGANWPVAWHQDLSLLVARRHDREGWTNWSIKSGEIHVQPPSEYLERTIAVRIHLDNCTIDNGPLKLIPGTHKLGRLSAERISEVRNEIEEHACIAPIGSALFMKPLLVHASSAAKNPRHRRVIHLEYAPANLLPPPLEWQRLAA